RDRAGGAPAFDAGNSRRLGSGIHSLRGRVPHAGSPGRRQDRDDRQPGAEPVHHGARLAIRVRCLAGAHGDRRTARLRADAARRRGGAVKRALGYYAAALYAFLHLPLLILAAFSFNSSRFTLWEAFSLRWYAAVFRDPELAEAAVNSIEIAVISTLLATIVG